MDSQSKPKKQVQTTISHSDSIADEVIDFLNVVVGKSFRHTNNNRKLIKARLREGFSLDDCKTVILRKSKNEYFVKNDYLNPITLFRDSNFERYLQEKSHDGNKVVLENVLERLDLNNFEGE